MQITRSVQRKHFLVGWGGGGGGGGGRSGEYEYDAYDAVVEYLIRMDFIALNGITLLHCLDF